LVLVTVGPRSGHARDVIDTLGRRFEEIVLPIPVGDVRAAVTRIARELVERRVKLRSVVDDLGLAIQENRLPEGGHAAVDGAIVPQ
jgi:hypothetical protein